MKPIIFLLLIAQVASAQRLKKADKLTLANLKSHISYLADDKLEGRRAGTPGEKLAYEYIQAQFQKGGLTAKGENNTYLQEFEINDGKQILPESYFRVNGAELVAEKEYFPLTFSPNVTIAEAALSTSLSERGVPWFKNLDKALVSSQGNPHFDMDEFLKTEANNAASRGASALIVYNTGGVNDDIKFNPKDHSAAARIPVIYLTKAAKDKYFKDESAAYDVKFRVALGDKKRLAHNVIGYIDNGAPSTIILGAHFDHLGYNEDGFSMLRTGEKLIHNGADDNASGTAALIELGRIIKQSKVKKNNYLFIAFSGEEMGLFGSKYYTDHPAIDLTQVNYMINMDMVGRLNDSSHTLTVGGYGTSPAWAEVISTKADPFVIKLDSSGTGPSDHTSFYRKDIPVLFFFTGLHSDYHKPTDDADKINYTGELAVVKYISTVITNLNTHPKLAFTKTREQPSGSSTRFAVTMGIMPDYSFSGEGVRVDGVSDGRPAQKAGLKTGDVIVRLGEYPTGTLESYMQALGKFKKGDNTKVKVKRGNEELEFPVVF